MNNRRWMSPEIYVKGKVLSGADAFWCMPKVLLDGSCGLQLVKPAILSLSKLRGLLEYSSLCILGAPDLLACVERVRPCHPPHLPSHCITTVFNIFADMCSLLCCKAVLQERQGSDAIMRIYTPPLKSQVFQWSVDGRVLELKDMETDKLKGEMMCFL